MFRNLMNISGAATPAVVAAIHATVNGTVYFDNCTAFATAWVAGGAGELMQNSSPSAGAAGVGGLFTNVT
jgi:hypothetical protein